MKKVLLEKWVILYQKTAEVTPACLLMMTQGDLTAITLGHWVKAFSTGALTALGMILLSFIKDNADFYKNEYLLAGLTAVVTMVVDFQIHPSHYAGAYTEAMMTGLAAGVISIIMTKFWKK